MDLSFLRGKVERHEKRNKQVSILVLMDLSFLQTEILDICRDLSAVSILVLMDLSFLQRIFFLTSKSTKCVSILVLMDLSFLRKRRKNQWEYWFMFQSLFLWIFRSYTKERWKMSIYTKMVSILVLMDLSFLREIEEEIDSKIDGFNPCSYGSFVLTD